MEFNEAKETLLCVPEQWGYFSEFKALEYLLVTLL